MIENIRPAWRIGSLAAAAALALLLAGCQPAPEELKTIPVPLPQNLAVEPPLPVIPPDVLTGSKGEDLWHLRSGLNVAALICRNTSMSNSIISNYNSVLTKHMLLLRGAAQAEVDLFKDQGGKWEDRYDNHMTKLYNLYSLTHQRPQFCAEANQLLHEAAGLESPQFALVATLRRQKLDLAAGVK